jgi:hypothetical protein
MNRDMLQPILQKVKDLGCHSVHIGGGEPFLNLDGLGEVIEVARSMSVDIEYVETNSSWFKGKESTIEVLSTLREKGLSILLISMSPFHNEHIPFYKVKGVIKACKETQINIFPWISQFYSEIEAFDDRTTHGLSAYESKYGENYLARIPSRYWIHFGGRALKTFAKVYGTKDYGDIVSASKGGCSELSDVSHFHIDLFGNYIPGLCSGLAIRYEDLGKNLAREEYPFLTTLYQSGIEGFLHLAESDYGFKPSRGYLSKCDLCFDIRHYLTMEMGVNSKELQPRGHYQNS